MKKRVSSSSSSRTNKWFPKGGYDDEHNSLSMKDRLRALLRKNRLVKPHREMRREVPFSKISSSSSSSPPSTKTTAHEDIENQEKKKKRLNQILARFRGEISKYQESSKHEYEADPYGVREIDDFVREFSNSRTLPRAAKAIQSTFRMWKFRRCFYRYRARQVQLKRRIFVIWRNSFRARRHLRKHTMIRMFQNWNKHVRAKITKAFRKEREENLRKVNEESKREYELAKYMPGKNFSSAEEEEEKNDDDDETSTHHLSIAELEKRRTMFNKRRRMRRIAKMRRLTEVFYRWRNTTRMMRVRRSRAVAKLREWSNDMTIGAAGRWLSEWKSICFTIWYRYTVFMKSVRQGEKSEPTFVGYLPEWTRFVKLYRRREMLDKNASKMSTLVTQRRYFRRFRAYIAMRRLKAAKLMMAIRNDENACLRRTLYAWHHVASSRGRRYRSLRSVRFFFFFFLTLAV